MQIKVKVWIDDNSDKLVFGGGKTEVLKLIDETGSISKAAKIVGMNYKKAWTHIKILEEQIEDELVFTKKGRGEDSGSFLTPKAKQIIQTYELLQADVKKFAQERFEELFVEENKDLINIKRQENDKA